jgi:hypothetical protein
MNTIKNIIIGILRVIRAPIMRVVKPGRKDVRFVNASNPLKPLSLKYGYDRGTPIDRIYIEDYMDKHKDLIKGRCLEIHDCAYTKRFGGKNVTHCDALDIDTTNKEANIYGDLRNLKGIIEDNTYNCLIITHTINIIDDVDAALQECYRILKPGGALILTVPGFIGPVVEVSRSFWRFNRNNTRHLISRHFEKDPYDVVTYGNVLAGQAFLTGLAAEELSREELMFNDPHYPIAVGAVAIK